MPRCKILRHFIYSLMKQYLTLLLIVFTFLLSKAQSPVKELSEQEFKAKVSEYAGGFEKWQFLTLSLFRNFSVDLPYKGL